MPQTTKHVKVHALNCNWTADPGGTGNYSAPVLLQTKTQALATKNDTARQQKTLKDANATPTTE